MRKRRRLYELSNGNDIRYRGPMSWMGFQILGWLCIVVSVYIPILGIAVRMNPQLEEETISLVVTLQYISTLSLPFLLIANFARILNNAEGYRTQLLRNGGVALGIFLLSVVFFSRYVITLISSFVSDPENVVPVLTDSFRLFRKSGFIAFNLFIDLFLCTLFMFFLNARPTRVFTGRKRYIFRAFALLPVMYEVASIALKGMAAAGDVALPLWVFPLLTVKPPMTFIVFILLAFYIKRREWHFRRHGKTHEEYQAFLQTNRNSLHFSVHLALLMALAGIMDLFVMTYMAALRATSMEALQEADMLQILEYFRVAQAMGFGEASIPLFLAAPLVLLFSYTRVPKNKRISMFVPLVAIVIIFVLIAEGILTALTSFSQRLSHVSIRELFARTLGYMQ